MKKNETEIQKTRHLKIVDGSKNQKSNKRKMIISIIVIILLFVLVFSLTYGIAIARNMVVI